MNKISSKDFENKYGHIINIYDVPYCNLFAITTKGNWLFLEKTDKDKLVYVSDFTKSSHSRCRCWDYGCHKCYINTSYYKLRPNLECTVSTYFEVYKKYKKVKSKKMVSKLKRTIMEITDEQF